jgi:flagellar biosynthesis/type III secretory pathway protein FliH
MNANELANLLEVDSWYKLVTREEITTMLRQQQAQLDATEQQVLDAFERGKMFGYAEGLRKAQEK